MPILNKYREVFSRSPIELFCGLCVFSMAAFGASVQHVASTALALLFIVSLFYFRSWPAAWRQLSNIERYVLYGFVAVTVSGFIAYLNVEDKHEFFRHIGRYIRFTMILPVVLLIVKSEIKVFGYFIAGVIFSGPVFLAIAIKSMLEVPDVYWETGMGIEGQYYQILFGCIAALNALIMTIYVVLTRTSTSLKLFILFSMFCALYASVLSVARSGWLALLVCAIFLAVYSAIDNKRIAKVILLRVTIVLLLVFIFSPASQIISDRWNQSVNQISRFVNEGEYNTPVGTRLALWHVAFYVWKEHPVVGSGPGDFDEDFMAFKNRGIYTQVEAHSNVHSIYFQALATTGALGFVALVAALFILPFILFKKCADNESAVKGLIGMCMVLSFAVFGLTESWILRSPFMAIYLAYFVSTLSGSFVLNPEK